MTTPKGGAPRLPYMPLYVDDWMLSVAVGGFTLAQRGAYLQLLIGQWKSPGGVLPKDDRELAQLSGLGDDWIDLGRPILARCFTKRRDGYVNLRCRAEWEHARDKWIKAVKAGRKRWK